MNTAGTCSTTQALHMAAYQYTVLRAARSDHFSTVPHIYVEALIQWRIGCIAARWAGCCSGAVAGRLGATLHMQLRGIGRSSKEVRGEQ